MCCTNGLIHVYTHLQTSGATGPGTCTSSVLVDLRFSSSQDLLHARSEDELCFASKLNLVQGRCEHVCMLARLLDLRPQQD